MSSAAGPTVGVPQDGDEDPPVPPSVDPSPDRRVRSDGGSPTRAGAHGHHPLLNGRLEALRAFPSPTMHAAGARRSPSPERSPDRSPPLLRPTAIRAVALDDGDGTHPNWELGPVPSPGACAAAVGCRKLTRGRRRLAAAETERRTATRRPERQRGRSRPDGRRIDGPGAAGERADVDTRPWLRPARLGRRGAST